jgi:hypothetical protein
MDHVQKLARFSRLFQRRTEMTHVILSLAWFEYNFNNLIEEKDRTEGDDIFLTSEGEIAGIVKSQKVPLDVDGVVFYYMQTPNEGAEERYVAVRLKFKGSDIRFHSPVRIDMNRHAGCIKRFSPQPRKIYDDCASELIWGLAVRNPLKFSELHKIAQDLGLADEKEWSKGRDRLIV